MTVARWLERAARAHPHLPAVAIGARTYADYRAFAEGTARLAGWLQRAGARPGDRVAIMSENRPEYLETLYAIWWAGCAAAPIDATLTGPDLTEVLEDADAGILFVGAKTAAAAAAAAPAQVKRLVRFGGAEYAAARATDPAPLLDAEPESLAWLCYTAGRSGRPKGAMLSHRALACMSISLLAEVDAMTPRDAQLLAAPLSSGAGLTVIPTVARAGVAVIPESAGFDDAETFELAAAWRRASLYLAPAFLRRMTASGADCDPSAFKTIVATGDALYVHDAIGALDRFGPRLAQVYGQAEFPLTIARLSKHDVADRRADRWRTKLGSAGRPFLEAEVTIREATGRPAPDGEPGEICVRGPLQMSGYWRDPQATAAALSMGWLRTGDLGRMDAQGYLTVLGPREEALVGARGPIHPREIEETLLAHPEVEQAAVIGDLDPLGPPRLTAYIVSTAAPEELERHCASGLPPAKRPETFRFLRDLPRTHTGRVARDALRRSAAQPPVFGPRQRSERRPEERPPTAP